MSDSRRDAWARIAPSFEQDRERVLKEHLSTYSVDSIPQMGVAPGRMELKGNHTDWGCGKTISLNIPFYFLAAVTPSHQNNGRVRVHSLNADSAVVEFSIASCEALEAQKLDASHPSHWSNYARGIFWSILKRGYKLRSCDVTLLSTVPMGGGLSSSAAFELALLHALLLMNDISLSPAECIMLAHDAESKYVGLSCGYLDQGTIELADKCALVIHHRPYGNEKFAGVLLPMDLEGKYVLIGGFAPKKDHKLAQSGYNERRAACESALPVLRDILGEHVHYLGDVSFGEFLWNEKKIRERLGKHSRTADYLSYIVGENHRVLLFQKAAKQRDWEAIPRLFSDTLECSLERFDIGDPDGGLKFLSSFVQREFPRAGVQNIGGGWSPTTAAFVPSEQAEEYRQKVSSEFAKRFHVEYRTFKVEGGVPSAGIIT